MNSRRLMAALAIFALVASGIGITIAVLTSNESRPPVASIPPPPIPAAPPRPQMPTPADFQVAVVVTEQNCSGTANCVYTYRIEPNFIGRHPLPEKEITVLYEVTGGHQPQPGDFTVHNGQARVLQKVILEGPPGARLQASVTRIVGSRP
jgi:hypothetical protein